MFSYNILINGYCRSKRIDVAMHLFHDMSNKGLVLDVVTYSTLIDGLCRVERPQAALELFPKMRACGQHPNPRTYAILLDGLFKNKNFVEAMDCLKRWKTKIWTAIL